MPLDYSQVTFANHMAPAEAVPPPPPPPGGVGTEVLNSKLMRAVKWFIGPCKCKERAAEWDAKGIDWCEANIDSELIPALREAAARFRLPWSEEVARRVVRGAIVRARRKARQTGR